MVIRDAQLRDAHEIAEVHVRTWQAAYAGIVPDEDLAQLSVGQREQFWTQVLSKDERGTLVLMGSGWVPIRAWQAKRNALCGSYRNAGAISKAAQGGRLNEPASSRYWRNQSSCLSINALASLAAIRAELKSRSRRRTPSILICQ